MSRITAPVAKLTRSLNSAATATRSSGLLESHYNINHGAVLMPKYAELLKNRTVDHDSSRTLTTTHRPTPQPTRSSSSHRRMQTFSSAAATSTSNLASMDFAVLPTTSEPAALGEFAGMRMPLLPDSYTTTHRALLQEQAPLEDLPLSRPEISVIAAHPENVATAYAMTEVEGFGVDGVELKWAHEGEVAEESHQPGLRDLWKGLVDDVVGRKAAV